MCWHLYNSCCKTAVPVYKERVPHSGYTCKLHDADFMLPKVDLRRTSRLAGHIRVVHFRTRTHPPKVQATILLPFQLVPFYLDVI